MLSLLLLLAQPSYAQKDAEAIDENHHEFEVHVGGEPFQFAPGDANGYTLIKGLIEYPGEKETGLVAWKLTIYDSRSRVVTSFTDKVLLQPNKAIAIAKRWDGRNKRGKIVQDGKYSYQLVAHFVPETSRLDKGTFETIPALFKNHETEGVRGTVIVNSKLDKSLLQKRKSAGPVAHNARPIEAGFPYNFYYGNFHSQSNASDGGLAQDCRSNLLCRAGLGPAQAYDVARNVAGVDFFGITDHNHQFDCSNYYRAGVPTCQMDPALVLQKYQDGLAAAQVATQDNTFVAVYGLEFGITTRDPVRGDINGHVGVLEAPVLFNWEEHRSGGSCYDVFVGRSDYAGLYAAAEQNPSDWGPILILNHPNSIHEFSDFALDDNAVDAVVGIEVVNGPAFSTAMDQSDRGTHYDGDNVYCTPSCPGCDPRCAFSAHRYMWALSKGFRVAPYASQDIHCNNYGVSTANRTVVLAPSLTKDNIMTALRQRHVYATAKDNNLQLIFSANNNAYIMGDQFVNSGPIRFHVSVNDPDPGEMVSEIRVYVGTPGSERAPSVLRTSTSSPFDFTVSLFPGEQYVFVYVIQADGSEAWSAPMWVTQMD
jgi:hypothetical protein